MKIIDQTPFYDHETGEISMFNRGKAIMKYGTGWFKEIEAQTQIISLMTKLLDSSYTLLRNITPPGLGANFPLILIGPAGVFFMYVTPLTGTFRAKGDQWGTISGNSFRDEKPNLLTRTERMARALQIFLQRQGQTELSSVEAVLLCSDPSINVDSLRPIIRIVMRDALERFIISITQARVAFSPDAVQKTIERLLNTPKPVPPQPSEATPVVNNEDQAVEHSAPPPSIDSQSPAWNSEPETLPLLETQTNPQVQLRKGMSKKQWAFLVTIFVIWCLLVAIFLIFVVKGQISSILNLLP